MTTLTNLTKLTLTQIKEALNNNGINPDGITHASFANAVKSGTYRYNIVFWNDDSGEPEDGSIYVFIGERDGLIKADF